LFDRYSLKIYRYTYSRVHHHETAEDITSQAFRDALESIGQYKPIGPFAAWLFTIARRRIADFFRRKNPTDELQDDLPQESPEILDRVVHREDLRDLEAQLLALNEEERELLRLRFAAEMRYKDIAVLVGKTPGAVKIAIYRLLNRLKENMEKTDG
jgi:RNA polymerase sigma-70 factor (ECF subfamily)